LEIVGNGLCRTDDLGKLFNLVKDKDDGKVDITCFVFAMHRENVHIQDPALYKRVNDLAAESKSKGAWTLQQFQREFKDYWTEGTLTEPPSIDEMVLMFDMLDTDHDGYISCGDICKTLVKMNQLKEMNFDLGGFLLQDLKADLKAKTMEFEEFRKIKPCRPD
jgi:hypothetical protein